MPESTVILDAVAIQRALTRIAHEIAERNEVGADVVLIGIPGGVPLSQRFSAILAGIWNQPVPVGILDVSMHRDDLDRRVAPKVYPTVIPFDVTGKTVVLVDDVLFSGRTTRAAMDALNDLAGPKESSWRCWWTAATANCPSRRTLSAKTCRRPGGKGFPAPLEIGAAAGRGAFEKANELEPQTSAGH